LAGNQSERKSKLKGHKFAKIEEFPSVLQIQISEVRNFSWLFHSSAAFKIDLLDGMKV